MARPHLILQDSFPYSLTARSNNRDWFQIPMPQCWKIFENEIANTSKKYGVKTHCFVLMSNHFHWLVTTPNSNLGQAMRYFMTETSRKLARKSGRINKIYGSRYKWTIVESPGYYANTLRYFYQNPLRAEICAQVDNYQWTTRARRSQIVLTACNSLDTLVPNDPREFKEWLNKIPEGPYAEMMKKALRRSKFQFPPHPTTKRPMSEFSFLKDDARCGGKSTGTLARNGLFQGRLMNGFNAGLEQIRNEGLDDIGANSGFHGI